MKRIILGMACAAASLFAQEPLTPDQIAANRSVWPREVTVAVAHAVPLMVNGKASGSLQAPAGKVYPLQGVSATEVRVDAMGSPMTFPIADTDLLARSEAVRRKQAESAAQAAAAQAAPAATPTPAPAAAMPTARPAPAANKMSAELAGKLVVADGRKLRPFDAATLGSKKYLAIYFSASWCPPCRAFTPELVSWYKRKKSARDVVDVILVPNDKSEEDMIAYMKDYKMDWPALDFETSQRRSPLSKYGGKGIPCLVIIDGDGKVLSHSYVDGQFVGPSKVLDDLDKLIKGS